MGLRYIRFRSGYEIWRRTGLLKKRFPASPTKRPHFTLEQWKNNGGNFFFHSKEDVGVPVRPSAEIEETFIKYNQGFLTFFGSTEYNIGKDYDWIKNPYTNYKYDVNKHWTEIPDFSTEAGDIKYVWEKSRFSFLYDIIRYDYHFGVDCADTVFAEILSWIKKNPVNSGPNYRCSQEISIRLMNWIFALHYYKNSEKLSEEVFYEIQNSIYWQVHHVYYNINFSRIAVRNNHAITETLLLYIAGIIFPFVPDFKIWSEKGKKWFEEEVRYQVYEDGTFLQFSMNYHRVVVQLLTWAIKIGELNQNTFDKVVYERAEKSLFFLRVCMDDVSKWLPNYGANDGALFFKLNSKHFRDFSSQLKALAIVLHIDAQIENESEDAYWCCQNLTLNKKLDLSSTIYSFPIGGYYVIRDGKSLSFIRCGIHKDRPSQADNLHLDIWINGQNLLMDSGSFQYNSDTTSVNYFNGTAAHNTVTINDKDQMKKGRRFTWYYWSQAKGAILKETDKEIIFKGTISAFSYLEKNILHTRTVIKKKNYPEWKIIDEVTKPLNGNMLQHWHTEDPNLNILAKDSDGALIPNVKGDLHSPLYGVKLKNYHISFYTKDTSITTLINLGEK